MSSRGAVSKFVAAVVVWAGLETGAVADTMNFDTMTEDDAPLSYTENGMTVTAVEGYCPHLHFEGPPGDVGLYLHEPGFRPCVNYYQFTYEGGPFQLVSFRVRRVNELNDPLFTSSSGATIVPTTTGTIVFPTEGWSRISSFRWKQFDGQLVIDDVTFIACGDDGGTGGCCGAEDSDGDGAYDLCDECPDDPDKVGAGICGCGVPDDDADDDAWLGCVDNCVETYNPDQSDVDADGVGDLCDNCRCVPNLAQQDGDGDGAGTACDVLDQVAVGQCLVQPNALIPQSQVTCLPGVGQVCM